MIASLSEKKKKANTNLDEKRKRQDDSMYSSIDKILKNYNIHQAAYHGGDLNGKGIKVMMEHADDTIATYAHTLRRM